VPRPGYAGPAVLRVLRHRDFALLWVGQAVSLVGDGVYLVAIAWLVYDLSNAPGALALVGFAWTLPQVATLLVAGVLSDRLERRRVLVIADLLRCAAIGGIAALALADSVELWQVVVLVVVYGFGQALFQPAFTAIVPNVVPRDELLQANALKELMEPVGMYFAGPALGGLLIAAAGVGTAFLLDAATFAVSAMAIRLMSRQPPRAKVRRSVRRELAEGFAYVRSQAWLWVTLCSAALALLATFGPFEVLLPYIIRNDLGGDAATFGIVLSAGGLGSIVAAFSIGRVGAPRRHVTFMYAAWAFAIALDVALAIAGAAWQMCVIAFVSYAASTVGMVVWNTLMQSLVPPTMIGRVSSFDWFVSIGLVPVSFAVTGPVAELIGARTTLAVAGVLGVATCALLFVPGVRDPERRPLESLQAEPKVASPL
jgi:predicted MFS family arabinose efflux permease